MSNIDLRFRQIHLDFHTSEHLPDIAINFSRKQFQEALKVAHVNAINVFAKGHVLMTAGEDVLAGTDMEINLDTQTGTIYNGSVFIKEPLL